MNKFSKDKLFKALIVLGVLLAFGIPETKAAFLLVPLAVLLGSVGVELLWGGISGIAADIAQGIANLIGAIVNMLGGLFYFVASELVDFAVKVNLLISTSEIVKSGFETTLLVANLGLVLGLIVLAFAIMTRAEWLVEARQAIPKFIAAALLINFGFFITTQLLINPSTAITKTIYEATQYDAESFRGAFQPDLDLRPAMKIRVLIAKSSDEDREKLEKYFELREGIYTAVSSNLNKMDEILRGAQINVSDTQRQIVSNAMMESIDEWIKDPIDHGFNFSWNPVNWLKGAAVWTWRTGAASIGLFTNTVANVFTLNADSDAALRLIEEFISPVASIADKVQDARNKDWTVDALSGGIENSLDVAGSPYKESLTEDGRGALVTNIVGGVMDSMNTSFSCDTTVDNKSVPKCQELLSAANLVAEQTLDPWEDTSITVMEVLFESLFVFLGSFSLLGIGVMFIIRYVALSILIILFPFAWLGWVFPKLAAAGGGKNIWTSWWSQFIKWLIFGPLAMFFFFLAVQGALSIQQLTVPTSLTVEEFHGAGTAGALGTVAGNLAVVLGLLMGGLYTANKLSIVGAKVFYNGAIKMRNWVGKQFKKLGKAPVKFAGKYAQRGWENTKSAIGARRAQLQSKELLSKGERDAQGNLIGKEGGKDITARLTQSTSATDRLRGHIRERRSQKYEDTMREHAERRYKYRDTDGKLQYMAPYRMVQVLDGQLAAKNDLGVTGGILALNSKGYEWEGDSRGALAYMEDNQLVDKYGMQKTENDLLSKGLIPGLFSIDRKAEDELVPQIKKYEDMVTAGTMGPLVASQMIARAAKTIKEKYLPDMQTAFLKALEDVGSSKIKIAGSLLNQPERSDKIHFGYGKIKADVTPGSLDTIRRTLHDMTREAIIQGTIDAKPELIPGYRNSTGTEGKEFMNRLVKDSLMSTHGLYDLVTAGGTLGTTEDFLGKKPNEKARHVAEHWETIGDRMDTLTQDPTLDTRLRKQIEKYKQMGAEGVLARMRYLERGRGGAMAAYQDFPTLAAGG